MVKVKSLSVVTGLFLASSLLAACGSTPSKEPVATSAEVVAPSDTGSAADTMEDAAPIKVSELQDEVHYGLTKDPVGYPSLYDEGFYKPGSKGITDPSKLTADQLGVPYVKNGAGLEDYKIIGDVLTYAQHDYIRSIDFGKDRLVVDGVRDSAEYEERNPDPTHTPDEYFWYLWSGDAYLTHLMAAPTHMLNLYPNLQSVKYTVYLDGKTYTLDKTRSELESYFGVKFTQAYDDGDYFNTFVRGVADNKEKMQDFRDKMLTIS